MNDLLDVTDVVIAALERANVPYSVGGSLASSFSGEPRASIDADILVALTEEQLPAFLDSLAGAYYADADAVRRAIATKTSANLIHRASGTKIDLFVAGSLLDRRQLERRQPVQVTPDRRWFVHSAEDILLQKLLWYRQGGEVSDRQWRDVQSILLVQGDRLDRGYLAATAKLIGLSDLLDRACQDVGLS